MAPHKKVEVRERSEIIKRRLKNPLSQASVALPLKDGARWEVRIANGSAHSGRISEMLSKGWDFVTPADVSGRLADYGFEERDGRIVRGFRGEEILMKMEREDFRDIQKAKAAQNIQSTFGNREVKNAILSAAEKEQGGDEGASFLERSLRHIEIHDSLQTIPETER